MYFSAKTARKNQEARVKIIDVSHFWKQKKHINQHASRIFSPFSEPQKCSVAR
jgi:hypothetical protein